MQEKYWETLQLDLKRKQKIEIAGSKVQYIEQPSNLNGLGAVCIGVDPGIHFGITLLTSTTLLTMWGTLPRDRFPGLRAITFVYTLLRTPPFEDVFHLLGLHRTVRVEGPAYSETVGQPLLEQVRFGFAYAFMLHYADVDYMQPNTARKLAFGHGRKAGKDIWITLNQNAADSIGLAIASAQPYLL